MSGWGAIYNNNSFSLQRQSEWLARLNEQAASGLRVLRPSDDPIDTERILSLRRQSASIDTYLDNLNAADMSLVQISTSLQQISGILTETRGYLTQATTGTLNGVQRASIAEGIDQLLEEIVRLVNSKSVGSYLFGGANTSAAPYAVTRSGGRITAVEYQGSLQELPTPVGPGATQSATLVGDRAFQSDQRGEPIFLGQTGAAVAGATSSVRGDVHLSVSHGTTTYGGGIGLAAGSQSDLGDTIVGSHTLTVNATDKTLRLDDGEVVYYEDGATNVPVTNSRGQVAYVDISGLTLGSGEQTVDVEATVELSIDNGLTATESDLTDADLMVTDSRDGRILYVDATGIEQLGDEAVRVPGTYDLFGTLINIRDLMGNEQGLSESEVISLLSEAADSLDEVMDGVAGAIALVGGRLQAVETVRTSLDEVQFAADEQISELQDADITQVAIDLARAQTIYEMTLMATGKLLGLNLLDFLQ